MNTLRKRSVLLLMCLTLSVALHAALIGRISGMEVLGLAGLISPKIFIANIVTEKHDSTGPDAVLRKAASVHGKKQRYHAPSTERQETDVESAGYQLKEGEVETDDKMGDSTVTAMTSEGQGNGFKADETAGEGVPDVLNSSLLPAVAEAKKPATPSLLNSTKEKFSYDIYWLGMFVGRAVLEAVNEHGNIKITSRVHSAPFVSTFYKVEDYAESTLINGAPANFRIKQREGRYRSDKETVFDPEKGRVTFFNYLKGTKDEHQAADKTLWDVISGFYYLRTRDFEVGKDLSVDIFDSNKFLRADVNVLRKERVKLSSKGEVDAVIVRPVLKSDGLFQIKGEILIWLTDDKNRIPVRVETKVPIGTVVAELKQIETQ